MKKYPVSRKADLVVQEMDGETLIYDLTENKAFCLNETSALVWQLSDGNRTVDEIGEILGQKLNSSANEDLVWFALDQLKKEKLIENESELGNFFTGMSRREVIKKVGLGTMIALPIVASIVAPLAIHANSACVVGGACECNVLMGTANSELCATSPSQDDGMGTIIGMSCVDTNCRCIRTNQGNAAGTCQR